MSLPTAVYGARLLDECVGQPYSKTAVSVQVDERAFTIENGRFTQAHKDQLQPSLQ
jgi:hypothetical protein